jgi:hypothetical protein
LLSSYQANKPSSHFSDSEIAGQLDSKNVLLLTSHQANQLISLATQLTSQPAIKPFFRQRDSWTANRPKSFLAIKLTSYQANQP